jgi:selenocysteine lyase/cysteine desulfurase
VFLSRDITRALFPGSADVVYLNTASMALGAAPVREAYDRALSEWVCGRFDLDSAEKVGEDCRRMFAGLIGAAPDEIALVPTASAAAGTVAASLGPARAGDNIVVGAQEFASNYYPWMMLRDRDYEVRAIPFVDGAPRVDDYAAAVDARTRLLAVSAVQSASGAAADLVALAELVHRRGGWIFVDASQAVGAVPLDVRATDIDLLATVSYKFLCGTRGMGYLFVRSELVPALRPITPGWKAGRDPMNTFYGPTMDLSPTASKLDTSLTWFAAYGERAALGMFEQLGKERIFEHNRGLMRRLREGLAMGNVKEIQSTIVSLAVADPEAVVRRLAEARVVAAVRAGRVRIAVQFYNTEEDVDLVSSLLTRGSS